MEIHETRDINQSLNYKYNLAALSEKSEQGFMFIVFTKPVTRLDSLDWLKKNDPEKSASALVMIPRADICLFGGELEAALFKNRELAQAFYESSGAAYENPGILTFDKAPTGMIFSPV